MSNELKHIEKLYKEALEVMKKKNYDYTGGDRDFFQNFLNVENLGLHPAEEAILSRCVDKFSRIIGQIKGADNKVGEKLTDTIEDFINYLAILHCYLVLRKDK